MAGKEGIFVILDVGKSMKEKYQDTEETRLNFGIESIRQLIRSKLLFNVKRDQIGIILMGKDGEENEAENVNIHTELDFPSIELLDRLNTIEAEDEEDKGDIFFTLDFAIDEFVAKYGKKKWEKKIFLITDGESMSSFSEKKIEELAERINENGIKVNIICVDFYEELDKDDDEEEEPKEKDKDLDKDNIEEDEEQQDKDKENKLLNQSVNLYMKQIDENIKKNNLIGNKQFTYRNSDNEINKLKLKLLTQQKTLVNTKTNMERMSTSFNKVNELIKSTNFNNNNIETNKITNAIAECQNFVKNMSRGLSVDFNNNVNNYNNVKNNNINDILKKSLQKDNLIDLKNLNDKKLPQKIFKQYFTNLSKLSNSMVDFGINNDDIYE